MNRNSKNIQLPDETELPELLTNKSEEVTHVLLEMKSGKAAGNGIITVVMLKVDLSLSTEILLLLIQKI